MSIDIYESAVRPQGRFGAVFEHDDDAAYFYLLDVHRKEGSQVIESFDACAVVAMTPVASLEVKWSAGGDMVGLFARSRLLAVYDLADGAKSAGRSAVATDRLRFGRAQ